MQELQPTVGDLLREWRQRRRLSQLALASTADVSQRHLSFVESGRALPSRDMLLRLADHLDVPPRERNGLLLAAGFAPVAQQRSWNDPALAAVRQAVEHVLAAHAPFPALAVDRHWTLVTANAAAQRLLRDIDPVLLAPPVNVLRIALHPLGLAQRIENLLEWREHLLSRLRRQVDASADSTLADLLEELSGYGLPRAARARIAPPRHDLAGVAVPLTLRTPAGRLSLLSTITVFGTPIDITLSELAIETFLPADAATAQALRDLADAEA